jgi:hypothetical protein
MAGTDQRPASIATSGGVNRRERHASAIDRHEVPTIIIGVTMTVATALAGEAGSAQRPTTADPTHSTASSPVIVTDDTGTSLD